MVCRERPLRRHDERHRAACRDRMTERLTALRDVRSRIRAAFRNTPAKLPFLG
jgi:hypothetical protein